MVPGGDIQKDATLLASSKPNKSWMPTQQQHGAYFWNTTKKNILKTSFHLI